MRSSKSRSRNKTRNQRSLGNVVNRVFDSSGPEGKVRGTPQQIIEKYLALARDAQLSHDRVAEQSFLQHAEHYTRMLGEAQREQAERQVQSGGGQPGGYGDDRDDRPVSQHAQNGHQTPNGQQQHGTERRDDRGERPDRNDRSDRNDRNDRGERTDQRTDRSEQRSDRGDRPERTDRPERAERREDRSEYRRDRDRGPAETAPTAAPAEPVFDALPEFLRPAPRGIPEARPVDPEEGPVDTPEAREAVDERPPEPDEAPRARKPRSTTPRAAAPRSATPRRTTSRRKSGDDATTAGPDAADAAEATTPPAESGQD